MKHKRILSILLAVMLVLSVLPVLPAFAAEYDLTVAGEKVTDTNKSNLAGGAMSYNSSTKTLTIKGDASYSGGVLIENQIDGLTITASGSTKYNLTTYTGDVIESNGAALTIKDANLSMITYAGNADRSAIYIHNGSKPLVIENSELYMNGGWTLCGAGGTLTVKESYLTIAAGERAVNGFSGISLSGCTLTKPEGGKYANGTIYESDGTTYAKNVTIARTYALKIAGVQVTDANKYDILGDGAFMLDTTSYSIPALYIKKDCNAGANNVIDSELDYLTITVDDKDVTLTAASGSGKVGIKSTGTVLLGSNNNRKLTIDAPTGIYIKASSNCNLLIGSMSVDVKNSVYGITGTAGKVGLSFYDAEVSVKANSEAVSDFKSISFDECELLEPADGTWDTGTIMTASGIKATTVRIGDQPPVENYNIMICGKTVTSANQDDVLGDGSVSFKKSGSSYYLTLKKDISWSNGATMPTIYSTLGDYLYIIVTGDVTVKRTGNGGAISHNDLLYISGNGSEDSKLTAIGTSINNNGTIYASGELDIYNANVDASGGEYGIHAGGKLEIKNSTVAAKGSYSAIYGDGGLSMVGNMGVVLPVGGQIFGADIRNADGSRATDVLLAPVENYDLMVCGKQVNSANAADIMGDGVFEYVPEEKILVVRGNCEWHDAPIIESSVEGLGISVMDDSVLKAVDASAIVLHKDAAIGGVATLTVSGVNAIYADSGELTLVKAHLNATGTQYGIRGGSTASLVILEPSDKAAVPQTSIIAKGGTAAIGGFANIALSGCYIKNPVDGEVKDGAIVDKNGSVAKEVEIVAGVKPGATTFTVTFNANGHGTAPAAQIVEEGKTAVKPADPTAAGWKFGGWYKEAACKNKYDFATPVTADITLYAKWTEDGGSGLVNPFVDVHESDYYYTPVLWAYYHTPQITTGVDKTHFGPTQTCTRAQIVTFLWRAKGCVEPSTTDNPFKDVPASEYFYKAVLWAVENGITNGIDATHFGPYQKCQRAHAVTFLYRAEGNPAYSSTDNPFKDVKSGEYYYDAVLWAVENGVTNGVDKTHFGPTQACQRGQIVTFLYRDLVGPLS